MLSLAFEEIKAIPKNWPIWYMLGFQDIQLRYRRSAFGPFWLTFSTAILIYTMGFLYGHLFKLDLRLYFPYLATGFISWQFIATVVNECSNAYIDSTNYLRNQEIYYSVFIMRIILRNLIIFAHNILAFLPIAIIFKTGFGLSTLGILFGLLIFSINSFFWGSCIALFSTRYRDIEQIMGSFIQVIFFVTPVMWMPRLLPEHYKWVIEWNPFAQFLCLIRSPLLNQPLTFHTIWMTATMSILGIVMYLLTMKKYKYRIIFWL